MSSKIVVTERNDVKIINDVSKLVTNLTNGETCNWVQEDSVRLVTKTIIKDGIYIANNDVGSPYGYSQVSVNGVGNKILGQLGEKSITKNGTYEADKDKDGPYYGYSTIVVNVEGGESGDGGGTSRPVVPGKDGDGDDAVGTVDDDGNIVVEKLPTRISINIYPNNLVYEDGQAIDYTGLRVKAFLPDDTEWGTVDDNELIKSVTVAEYGTHGNVYTEVANPFAGDSVEKIYYDKNGYISGEWLNGGTPVPDSASYTAEGDSVLANILFNSSANGLRYYRFIASKQRGATIQFPSSATVATATYAFTYDNKTVYWGMSSPATWYKIYTISPPFIRSEMGYNYDHIAWAMLYAEDAVRKGGSDIPLKWKRPGDGKVLETSFTITVYASDDSGDSGGSGGSNGPQPQPTPPPS